MISQYSVKKISHFFGILLTLLGISFLSEPTSFADDIYTIVVKKQEEKKKRRWTLSEWLETRDRMRLMDLWLALHSPTPYEFYLGGEWRQTETDDRGTLTNGRFYGAAYASIFGLGFERGFGRMPEWLGLFYLRIFGFHAQATNITLQVGLRSRDEPVTIRQALTGVSLTFYLAKYVGIEGLYRHYFKSTPTSNGLIYRGFRAEGGAFIDFKFLRIYGSYFSEPDRQTNSSTSVTQKVGQTGFQFGTRLFF